LWLQGGLDDLRAKTAVKYRNSEELLGRPSKKLKL
jgi:hypothetical protein